MTRLAIALFDFFRKHKTLMYIILFVSFSVFVFLGLKVNYEEDISKLLPSTENGGSERLVFQNLQIKDKIFVVFNKRNDEVEPETLAEVCDAFVEEISQRDSSNLLIDNILSQMDESMMVDAVGYLYENAPTFFDTANYGMLSEMLTPEAIDEQMANNFALMQSAAGSSMMDMVRTDPIAIRNVFLERMSDLKNSLGGNYAIYESHFFTPDTTVAIAFISPAFKSFDSKSGIKLVELIEESTESLHQAYPDVEIIYHGAPVQSVYNSRCIKKDLLLTLAISMSLACLVIGICFKNKSTLPLLISPVVYGSFFALSVIYLIKGGMSLMALGIGAIVLGVALSYCLHVLTHFKYVGNPIEVLRDQTKPVILGCITTIGSFMGLMFTKSDLLRDFGLFASLALLGTTFFALIFLPHFMNEKRNRRSVKAFHKLEQFNSYPFEKQKWLIVVIVVIFAVSLITKSKVTFDSNLRNIGYYDTNVMRSQDLLASKSTPGYITTYFASTSKNFDEAIAINGKITQALDKEKESGKVKNFSQISDLFVSSDVQQMRIDAWKQFWNESRIEETKKSILEAGAKYKFKPATFIPFFNMIESDYEPISVYESEILPRGIMSNMVEYTDSTYMIFTSVQLRKEDQRAVSDIVAQIPGSVVIDPFYYTSDMVSLINDDFNTTLWIASAFVFIVLLISFKSLIISILAFLPMMMSWYIVLGVMGAFHIQFNLISIVISTFIFGIGVDYSIFVMDGLLAKRNKNKNILMYHKTAIFFSAFVLIVGISSLMFAKHPAIKSIGLSTLIGMTATVLLAYTLQPFLFNFIFKNRKEKSDILSESQTWTWGRQRRHKKK